MFQLGFFLLTFNSVQFRNCQYTLAVLSVHLFQNIISWSVLGNMTLTQKAMRTLWKRILPQTKRGPKIPSVFTFGQIGTSNLKRDNTKKAFCLKGIWSFNLVLNEDETSVKWEIKRQFGIANPSMSFPFIAKLLFRKPFGIWKMHFVLSCAVVPTLFQSWCLSVLFKHCCLQSLIHKSMVRHAEGNSSPVCLK